MLSIFRNFFESTVQREDDWEIRWIKWGFIWATVWLIPFMALVGSALVSLDLQHLALIPAVYVVLSTLSLVHIRLTRRHEVLQWSQLMMVLILPSALMWAMGIQSGWNACFVVGFARDGDAPGLSQTVGSGAVHCLFSAASPVSRIDPVFVQMAPATLPG